MNYANCKEGPEAEKRYFLYNDLSIDLDHAFVVGDVGGEDDTNYRTYERSHIVETYDESTATDIHFSAKDHSLTQRQGYRFVD